MKLKLVSFICIFGALLVCLPVSVYSEKSTETIVSQNDDTALYTRENISIAKLYATATEYQTIENQSEDLLNASFAETLEEAPVQWLPEPPVQVVQDPILLPYNCKNYEEFIAEYQPEVYMVEFYLDFGFGGIDTRTTLEKKDFPELFETLTYTFANAIHDNKKFPCELGDGYMIADTNETISLWLKSGNDYDTINLDFVCVNGSSDTAFFLFGLSEINERNFIGVDIEIFNNMCKAINQID